MKTLRRFTALAALCALGLGGCGDSSQAAKPREVLFVGVDVSGSFQKGPYAKDSMDFLARYLYAHLNGLGALEVPQCLFVGAIGGLRPQEPKSFQPIEAFAGKNLDQIRATLDEMFPAGKYNPDTDYNAFLTHVGEILLQRNLALKPVTVVMLTDGKVDVSGVKGGRNYRNISLAPLERYSRNVTVRLLYTDPQSGADWQRQVPRHRARIWTQDAEVMARWKDPNILNPALAPGDQAALFHWIQQNVDFGVRAQRVD